MFQRNVKGATFTSVDMRFSSCLSKKYQLDIKPLGKESNTSEQKRVEPEQKTCAMCVATLQMLLIVNFLLMFDALLDVVFDEFESLRV